MDVKSFTFSTFNEYSYQGISESLKYCTNKTLIKKLGSPIILCIGSDLVLGDSLGPLVGTFLTDKNLDAYVYGTLKAPVTAKEIAYTKTLLKNAHPNSLIIAVDAAVGDDEDVGLVRVANCGLKPGLGVEKALGTVGDISIMGIVAGRSNKNYNLFNLTRLGFVYKMAQTISSGIEEYFTQTFCSNKEDESHPAKTNGNFKKAFIPVEEVGQFANINQV